MTTALEVGEGSVSRPGRSLPPGKTRYPLFRRLGGPQGRSGQVRKISPPPPGFDPRTVQPVASRYTDWATRAIKAVGKAITQHVEGSKCSRYRLRRWRFKFDSDFELYSVDCSFLPLPLGGKSRIVPWNRPRSYFSKYLLTLTSCDLKLYSTSYTSNWCS